MINARIPILSATALMLLSATLYAGDLSQYRQFQLNSDLPEVATQAGMKLAQAKTVHHRPATIQELTWPAEYGDSVKEIQFSFYSGELFRMIVEYDRQNTLGLTADDLVKALSTTYGEVMDLSGQTIQSSDYDRSKGVNALARWEDSDWSFNLVRFKYESSFSLVALSKRLEASAQEAVLEALRLDRIEAPQRRLERQQSDADEQLLQQEKSRLANRPGFRP